MNRPSLFSLYTVRDQTDGQVLNHSMASDKCMVLIPNKRKAVFMAGAKSRYAGWILQKQGHCHLCIHTHQRGEIQKSDEVWHANLQYKCVLIKENGYHYPKAQQPDGCMDLTTSRNLLSFITRSSHWNCGKQFNVSLESQCTHILVPAGAHTQAPPCCFAA
ncbi:hypothetical protein AcV5_010516 [Taiwanofungus camphoratus]|nr:hypothetical protein AcV5_010516 [Antrodia cinnamomea]